MQTIYATFAAARKPTAKRGGESGDGGDGKIEPEKKEKSVGPAGNETES